jgi:hypothetical protein
MGGCVESSGEPTGLNFETPMNKLRAQVALAIRAEMRKRTLVEGLIDNDELRFCDGTEGFAFIGDTYGIDSKSYMAYRNLMNMFAVIEDWFGGKDTDVEFFRRLIRAEFYARTQKKEIVPRIFSHIMTELVGESLDQGYRPVNMEEIRKKLQESGR